MTRVRAAGYNIWEFVVGDDWRLAAGVVVTIGATAIVAGAGGVSAWWIIPVGVAVLLVVSVLRASR